ncbi:heme-binding protein [Cypionkella sp.]|uniref:GlcG/HbpS family heme-binding protein n=1 Tax=Cypionkella sp. TaxID=2811411 RepID=UPI002ABB7758|nr:heme-binding protein [Cypionkella sp.]MDZ4392674.1 heme-binding protein [Cypionkella sp.]
MIHLVPVLASATAMQMTQAAIAHAEAQGWKIAVAIVDPSGVALATCRMDAVTPPISDYALDKAYTAATMRCSTAAYFERMDGSPSLRLGLANRDRVLVWGGGLPILHDGIVVGGIGISGAQDFEDIACCQAALLAVGLATPR